MLKQLLYKASYNWLMILLFVSSCAEKENTSVKNTSSATYDKASFNSATSTKLDTLWIDPTAFKTMRGKDLNFIFFIVNENTLTLHGWSGKSKDYNGRPANIELLNGGKSNKEVSSKTYISSLRINKKDVNSVIEKIKSSHKAVLFIPNVTYSPTTRNRYISYKIFLSNLPPTKQSNLSIKEIQENTGYELNPSPPRGFEEE